MDSMQGALYTFIIHLFWTEHRQRKYIFFNVRDFFKKGDKSFGATWYALLLLQRYIWKFPQITRLPVPSITLSLYLTVE